jgi:hypothetical protein
VLPAAWLAQGVEIAPEGRQDQDIGRVETALDGNRYAAEAAYRLAVGADQACLEARDGAQALAFSQAQAGHVKQVAGLHQCGSQHAFTSQDADPAEHGGWRVHCFCKVN